MCLSAVLSERGVFIYEVYEVGVKLEAKKINWNIIHMELGKARMLQTEIQIYRNTER